MEEVRGWRRGEEFGVKGWWYVWNRYYIPCDMWSSEFTENFVSKQKILFIF